MEPNMKTLSECHTHLLKNGYTEEFRMEEGMLYAPSKETSYNPSQITINNFYRFEGQSNPDDNSILYALHTTDGLKGTLVDAYGTYADTEKTAFIHDVEAIQKKPK